MAWPPAPIAADKTTGAPASATEHPDHHNQMAAAINDTVDHVSNLTTVAMSTPASPQAGDLRWNPAEDPPTSGGAPSASEVYAINKVQFVGGANVSVVPDDQNSTITINSSGGGGGASYMTWLNAQDYGLSTAASAAVNTAALRACINAAAAAKVNVFIPAGEYVVGHQCLTPTLGSAVSGLEIIGEGMYRSVLQMERNVPNSYFFDNSSGGVGNGNTLRYAKFRDLGFTGGLTDTSAQRSNTNDDCLGFRLYAANGAADQSFKFTRCRFATMGGVWKSWGSQVASEIGFTDCKISHISNYVLEVDNLQALDFFYWNCDVEIIWGDMIRFVKPPPQESGGSVGVFGGSWIIQSNGGQDGCVVKLLNGAGATSVINFFGTRFEIRNTATVIDGSQGALLTVNFDGCNLTTIPTTGALQTVNITTNQFVGFTRCTFEHNGSYATYNVQGTGWLIFDQCAVRGTLANEITTGASATAMAINCRERFNYGNAINFTE